MTASALLIKGLNKKFCNLARSRGKTITFHKFKLEAPRVVFENFDMDIKVGEKVLLEGPNGCGKTTLLKLISGLLLKDSGEVSFGKLSPEEFRHQVGLMLSFEMLYMSLSTWENLEFSGQLHCLPNLESAIKEAAAYWKLERHLDTLAHSLSYGLRARLSVARATLHRPKLLLLDEPTVALDKEGNEILIDYLKKTDATVLIATHQTELFKDVASRSINLGQITASRGACA